MAIRLSKELESLGCKLDETEFRETLLELHVILHPSWTDEELLFHPRDASVYCEAIRFKTECSALPDHLILRTLINTRKKSG